MQDGQLFQSWLARTRKIHLWSRQRRRGRGGECSATDATATWRQTAPSIICRSPDDGSSVSDYRGKQAERLSGSKGYRELRGARAGEEALDKLMMGGVI